MPSMSRDIEMLCGGFDAERADHADPLAERDRKRRVGAAAADQEHGGVAGGIDIATASSAPVGTSRRITVACSDRTRSAACRRAIRRSELPCGLRKTEWHCRASGRLRIDRDQRQIGLVRRDLLGERGKAGLIDLGHGGKNRGRAATARRRAPRRPSRSRSPETVGLVKRGRERRPPRGRHDKDRALLGHLATRIDAIVERAILVCRP